MDLKHTNGSILPAAMVFSFIGIAIVFSYFSWLEHRWIQLRLKIAQTTAEFNAQTGLAEGGYPNLVKSYFPSDSLTSPNEIENMQEFLSVSGHKGDSLYKQLGGAFGTTSQRVAMATGYANIINAFGEDVQIERKVMMAVEEESLAKYMYLTDSEFAGGGPFTFDSPLQRRSVNFSSNEIIDGWIQTNGNDGGTMQMSSFGCPDFSDAHLIITDQTNIDLGACNNWWTLFQGEPDTTSAPKVNLPPKDQGLVNYADVKFDAGIMLHPNDGYARDTLIMTDIEFLETGAYLVKQWWYLNPPHLTPDALEVYFANVPGNALNGLGDTGLDPDNYCSNPADLMTCTQYEDSLESYHAKTIVNDVEQFMELTVSGPHGIHNFDYEPLDDNGNINYSPVNYIINDEFYPNGPTVIHVENGPVRVHGKYNGMYTIVTHPGYTTYRRHTRSLLQNNSLPPDTIWNDIWITDDIMKADSPNDGDISNLQPTEECSEVSPNILGLVSYGNIIIANTKENGAKNKQAIGGNADVIIQAAMVAYEESFVTQYWQNTLSGMNAQYSQPPYGDGRGVGKFGPSNNIDQRGDIILWGSVVQKFRGYVVRNNPGPYPTNDIGYNKDYHYDSNLRCIEPPHYPTIEYDNALNEIDVKLTTNKYNK